MLTTPLVTVLMMGMTSLKSPVLYNLLSNQYVLGGKGDDILSGITLADGGDGDDEIITFSTSVRNHLENGGRAWDVRETSQSLEE